MRKLELFEYEQQLSRRVTEIFKQMAELLQLREFVRLAEDRQGQTSIERSREMSRSLLNYVGPTLPGMNVTRPS